MPAQNVECKRGTVRHEAGQLRAVFVPQSPYSVSGGHTRVALEGDSEVSKWPVRCWLTCYRCNAS